MVWVECHRRCLYVPIVRYAMHSQAATDGDASNTILSFYIYWSWISVERDSCCFMCRQVNVVHSACVRRRIHVCLCICVCMCVCANVNFGTNDDAANFLRFSIRFIFFSKHILNYKIQFSMSIWAHKTFPLCRSKRKEECLSSLVRRWKQRRRRRRLRWRQKQHKAAARMKRTKLKIHRSSLKVENNFFFHFFDFQLAAQRTTKEFNVIQLQFDFCITFAFFVVVLNAVRDLTLFDPIERFNQGR